MTEKPSSDSIQMKNGMSTGPAKGLSPDIPLFIYTDGLNEAEDGEQRQFGDDQLLEILRVTHFDTARQVVETLTQKVEEHRAGAEPNDDLTMLCLRVS